MAPLLPGRQGVSAPMAGIAGFPANSSVAALWAQLLAANGTLRGVATGALWRRQAVCALQGARCSLASTHFAECI